MSFLTVLSGILQPVADIVDNVSTTDEERLKLKNELSKILSEVEVKLIDYHTKALEGAAKVAEAETKSDAWLTKNYRPLIVCGLFLLLVLDSFGVLQNTLPDVFISVFGAVFGVVSAGRSIEKVTRVKRR
jgi:hypothetical protein